MQIKFGEIIANIKKTCLYKFMLFYLLMKTLFSRIKADTNNNTNSANIKDRIHNEETIYLFF